MIRSPPLNGWKHTTKNVHGAQNGATSSGVIKAGAAIKRV